VNPTSRAKAQLSSDFHRERHTFAFARSEGDSAHNASTSSATAGAAVDDWFACNPLTKAVLFHCDAASSTEIATNRRTSANNVVPAAVFNDALRSATAHSAAHTTAYLACACRAFLVQSSDLLAARPWIASSITHRGLSSTNDFDLLYSFRTLAEGRHLFGVLELVKHTILDQIASDCIASDSLPRLWTTAFLGSVIGADSTFTVGH